MSKNTLLIMGMAFACAHSPYAMATDEAEHDSARLRRQELPHGDASGAC